jgi:hypothetical protein
MQSLLAVVVVVELQQLVAQMALVQVVTLLVGLMFPLQ